MMALPVNPVNKNVRKKEKIRIYHNTTYNPKMGKVGS